MCKVDIKLDTPINIVFSLNTFNSIVFTTHSPFFQEIYASYCEKSQYGNWDVNQRCTCVCVCVCVILLYYFILLIFKLDFSFLNDVELVFIINRLSASART